MNPEPKWLKDLKHIVDYTPPDLDQDDLVVSLLIELEDRMSNVEQDLEAYEGWTRRTFQEFYGKGEYEELYQEQRESKEWLKKAKRRRQQGVKKLRQRMKDKLQHITDKEHRKVYSMILTTSDSVFLHFYTRL